MEKVHLERVGTTMEAGHTWIDTLYEKNTENPTDNSDKGAIIYADVQDHGRGSKGRHWESSTIGNVYVTYVIPMQSFALDKFTLLPAIIALSVHKALSPYLQESQHQLRIKWPNDVLDDSGRKISGSIIETYRGFLLVGIGINIVNVDRSSPSFKVNGGGRVPCSLSELVEDGTTLPSAEEVIDKMYWECILPYVKMIGNDVGNVEREKNGEKILGEWSAHVDWSVPVTLRDDPVQTKWIPLRVTKDGFLRIKHPETGIEKTLIDSYLE